MDTVKPNIAVQGAANRGWIGVEIEDKGSSIPPVRVTGLHSLEAAVQMNITRLYAGFSLPEKPLTRKQIKKSKRNKQIKAQFASGEGLSFGARVRIIALARLHGSGRSLGGELERQ
jgi:hypothetical protein